MDVAAVVNLRSRRGSEGVASSMRAVLPRARVMASRTLDDVARFADDVHCAPPELLISAGGDGSAVALINALRTAAREHAASDVSAGAPIAVLPLGTGNGWACATGAPRWRTALARLGQATEPRTLALPRAHFDLLEVEGTLAPFAGTGWDAELIEDFHAQKTGPGLLPMSRRHGLLGYLHGLFTRTVPRHLGQAQVEVEIVNTGDDALTVDAEGRAVPVRGGEHGAVLYRGPVSICAAATSPEWGFHFRAFPFARLVRGRFNLRVYSGKAIEAVARMGQLWRGVHPLPRMESFLLTSCRVAYSAPVPFQIGGDRFGLRTEVNYATARESVDLLDWSRLVMA